MLGNFWMDNFWIDGFWHEDYYPNSIDQLLRRILLNMEKKSIGDFCFEAGCVEPGIDNANTPLRKTLSNLG